MKTPNNRDGSIDSLRGLSIILVVMYHYTFHYDQNYLFFNNEKITIFRKIVQTINETEF